MAVESADTASSTSPTSLAVRRSGWRGIAHFGGLVLALAGVAFGFALFASNDIAAIGRTVAGIGWSGLWLVPFHGLPLGCDMLGWRALFRPVRRPSAWALLRIRWLSESVNTLLPVAQIGGEVVRVLLVSRRRPGLRRPVGTAEAAAVVMLDVTLGFAAVVAFCLVGLPLSAGRAGLSATAVGWTVAVLLAMLVAFVLFQRSASTSRLARLFAAQVGGRLAEAVAVNALSFDGHLTDRWADRGAVAQAFLWRFASLALGIVENWIILALSGLPAGWSAAVAIEVAGVAARTAFFVVPGGVGVQEGAVMLIGGMAGLSAQAALALAAVKRGRALVTAAPGLLLWLAARSR